MIFVVAERFPLRYLADEIFVRVSAVRASVRSLAQQLLLSVNRSFLSYDSKANAFAFLFPA